MNRLVLWLLFCFQSSFIDLNFMAEKEGFEPSRRYSRPTPFPGEPLQPLGYFSIVIVHFSFQINAETGIRTQGGVTLAGFQDRCLKPTRPSLHIYLSFRHNRLLRYYTKHLFLSTTFSKNLFSNLRTNFLSNLLPSLVLI